MEYKMKLTDAQRAVLDGAEGEVKAKVMLTLVKFGEIFGAEKAVEAFVQDYGRAD